MSGGGEADASYQDDGGVEGGETDVVIGMVIGEVGGGVAGGN